MIRYVLAVLLTAAIFGIAGLAIDNSAADSTERDLQTGITEIEDAAVALTGDEELSPDGHPNPKRTVTVDVPADSLLTEGVQQFKIEPAEDAPVSFVRYRLADGTGTQEIIDEQIVYDDPSETQPTEINASGTAELTLVLESADDGTPVVVVDPEESTI